MSYFCMVPTDATDKEHLTLVWMGDDKRASPDRAEMANLLLPTTGVVYGYAEYAGRDVALVALKHRIHLMRDELFARYDHSGWRDWSPHITYFPNYKWRCIGEEIVFSHVEWRA